MKAVTLGVLVSLVALAMLTGGQPIRGLLVGVATWGLVARHIRRSAADRVRIDTLARQCTVERTTPDGVALRTVAFDHVADVELVDPRRPNYGNRRTTAGLAFVLHDGTRVNWSPVRWSDARVLYEVPRLALAAIQGGVVPDEVPPLATQPPDAARPLPAIVPVLGYLGIGLLGFGLWGTTVDAGRRLFDEMAGIIPMAALSLGTLLLLAFAGGRAVHAMRSRVGR